MKPSRRRTRSGSFTQEKPSTKASPAVGRSSVARIRMLVVFPAPFGPMKPKTCPRPTSNDTSCTARVVPKKRYRRRSSMIGKLADGDIRRSWLVLPTDNVEAGFFFHRTKAGDYQRRGFDNRDVAA